MILLFFCHERMLLLPHRLLSPTLIMRTRIWILSTSTIQEAWIMHMQFDHLTLSQLCHSLSWDSVLKIVTLIMVTVPFLPTVKGTVILAIKLNRRFHMWRIKEMSLFSTKKTSLNCKFLVLCASLQPCCLAEKF